MKRKIMLWYFEGEFYGVDSVVVKKKGGDFGS